MIFKIITSTTASDEEFREVLKARIYLFLSMILLGVITMVLSIIFSNGKYAYLTPFTNGIYSGFGGAILVIGIIFMIRTKKVLRNEKRLKETRLWEQDERNKLISQKTRSATAIILIILLYVGIIVSGIFNMTVFWTLWTVIMLYFFIFILFFVYYNKKL
jgi:ABC-type transport system involved in multi-copper enzyme maturation permease subunit